MKKNFTRIRMDFVIFGAILLATGMGIAIRDTTNAVNDTYKIFTWNDLGMHCYNRDFADMAVLPPYNTLWVQVVRAGEPPTLVTSGIKVEYSYADNTYSVGKTNFWSYDQALFGVDLPPDVGLKGKGLSGTMDLQGDHFIAEGIPITEYSDSAPTIRHPYQLATVVVKDSTTGVVLASTRVVTPTSSEMRCDNCHSDTGIAKPQSPTGKTETNILQLHDEKSGTTLMANRPVLCATCHGSNALGMSGDLDRKNLSKAMHEQHSNVIPNTLDGCYNCHPGPETRCLRDVMSTEANMTCINCHGGMSQVSTNPDPWLHEPRCDTCHNSGQYQQDQALYRFSKGHAGLYCEACHDSTHAVAPSREGNDTIKFIALQGENGPVEECSVCHTGAPNQNGGPHQNISTHMVSGKTGVGGVMLHYTDGSPKSFTSDSLGNYVFPVSNNWSGTVTPYKTGYAFIPSKRSYSKVIEDQSNQNYTAIATTPITYTSVGARDGWIRESSETSGTGGTKNYKSTTLFLGDDVANKQYRSILSFNTNGIPTGANITKVTLMVKKSGVVGGGNPLKTFKGILVDIKKGNFGTATLALGDFKAAASKTYGPFKPALSGGWYSIDLTSGQTYINRTGNTQIRLRFKLDDNNNSIANYLKLYSGNAPVASRPQLIVEYYVP